MSPATLRHYRAQRLLQRDFRALRVGVLATVSARLRTAGAELDSSELDACYATAWQGLYAAALGGEEIANPRAWLVLVTYRRAIEELRAARRRDEPLDHDASFERDLDVELDERDRLRSLLQGMRARLDVREREAAALCYLHGYSRGEAARLMGLSETRMRKLMEGNKGRAGVSAKVAELAETIRQGGFCEQQGSLMRALAFGVLDPAGERYTLAVAHRRDCPACRRYVATLRGAAVVLPPVLTLPAGAARGLAGLAGLGHHVAAGPASASIPSLGASAATGGGGAAGGGWALGGAGAKLAAGCLLAVGIGAGCVVIEQPGGPGHRGPSAATVLPAAGASAALPTVLRAPSARHPPVSSASKAVPGARRPSPHAPAGEEFGIEQQTVGTAGGPTLAARASAASSGSRRDRAPSAAPTISSGAAAREFSPG
jgi:RNA polymerase sigma factor (sigma-70 family)